MLNVWLLSFINPVVVVGVPIGVLMMVVGVGIVLSRMLRKQRAPLTAWGLIATPLLVLGALVVGEKAIVMLEERSQAEARASIEVVASTLEVNVAVNDIGVSRDRCASAEAWVNYPVEGTAPPREWSHRDVGLGLEQLQDHLEREGWQVAERSPGEFDVTNGEIGSRLHFFDDFDHPWADNWVGKLHIEAWGDIDCVRGGLAS